MNSKERRYDLFLEDILNSIKLIEEYIGTLEFKEFKQSRMVVDAVIRNFEIIGEAAKTFLLRFKSNILKSRGKKCIICEIL